MEATSSSRSAIFAIAAENASVFGQAGPKVGSVDPGWGTAYLSHLVGEKKAREIWYLCRKYPADVALQMGLCNAVVPLDRLDAEVEKWCNEILEKSPTAIAIAKRSFNADTEHIRGIGQLGMQALAPLLSIGRVARRRERLQRKTQTELSQAWAVKVRF